MRLHPADRPGLRMKLPAHESTTAQLGVAYPFVASAPCQANRVFIGQDLAGGPFFHDPFELYREGILTNPNVTVFGQIGRGKSALVKTYLLREAAFGRQVAVLDPKGEYGALARALGSSPLALSPGGSIRVNPLEGPASPPGMTVARHRLVLLGTLASACLRRSLAPREHAALELALGAATRANLERESGPPTLPDVVRSLLRPLGSRRRSWERPRPGSRLMGGTWDSSFAGWSKATSLGCSTVQRRPASTQAPACSLSTFCRVPLRGARGAHGVRLSLVAGHDGAQRDPDHPGGRRGLGDLDRARGSALSPVVLEAGPLAWVGERGGVPPGVGPRGEWSGWERAKPPRRGTTRRLRDCRVLRAADVGAGDARSAARMFPRGTGVPAAAPARGGSVDGREAPFPCRASPQAARARHCRHGREAGHAGRAVSAARRRARK